MGTAIASGAIAIYSIWKLWHGGWVVEFPRGASLKPDLHVIKQLFRFGLPTGFQGIAMNIGGVLLLSFIGSVAQGAAAQAAYAIAYTELFSLITWTSVGLMGATAAIVGQNIGAGHPDRANEGVYVAAKIGLTMAAALGVLFLAVPRVLLEVFGMTDPTVVRIGIELMR